MLRSGIVTLTTDFGRRDIYAGLLHAVILGIDPRLRVVDLTHDVAPHAILEAAFLLESAYRYFPPGTVHLAVVDPGVGTARPLIAIEAGAALFVAPDNGLLTVVWQGLADEERRAARIVELTEARLWRLPVSSTFHGRDILAPVAAHLAAGRPLEEAGPPREGLTILPEAQPTITSPNTIQGRIVHIDRFGNCSTNIPAAALGGASIVTAGGHPLGWLRRTYADVAPGQPLALAGSDGRLEVAVREGSAAETLGLRVGDPVWVRTPHRTDR